MAAETTLGARTCDRCSAECPVSWFVDQHGYKTLCALCSAALHGTGAQDAINPSHYRLGGVEVIDAIEAWELGFHLGNAVKYIARAGKKDPAKRREDLEKARWYLDRELGRGK